jgi:hypothetical protein
VKETTIKLGYIFADFTLSPFPFHQFQDIVNMSKTLQIIILDANEPNSHWEKNKFSPLFEDLIRSLSQQGVLVATPIISSYDVVQGEYPRSLNGVDVVVITGSCRQ